MSLLRLIPHPGLRKWFWMRRIRRRIGACGERVNLAMDGSYTLPNIFLGNDIHIGARAIIWTVNNKIIISDKVIIGPKVIVNGSDHDITLSGKFMIDIKEEKAKDIVFETDVWVGARATILKGVRIGRGAVVGAGAVVTKSIPPYWIVAGNPARPLRLRGAVDEILEHERRLYPPDSRLSPQALEESEAQFRAIRAVGSSDPFQRSCSFVSQKQ